ncbi:MAG: alpha/beta hydrolase, partial [Solirubrobacteraceae bacterium]
APIEAVAAPVNPLERPQARRAFELWRAALTLEDRSGLWRGERAGYERFMLEHCAAPADLGVEPVRDGEVAGLLVTPAEADPASPVVLHLHGGGFVFGSAATSVALTGRLAREVGGRGLTIDYRLAPEHAFPAALEDALAAYRWLRERYPDAPILVSGECAGGGLAISLAVSLRAAGEPGPSGIHVVSPFCDLTITSPSSLASPATDPWLNRNALFGLAGSYIDDADPANPLISPVHADLSDLPPLYIAAAAGEALRDDATRLAAAARDAGTPVTFDLVEDTIHSFVVFDFLPESRAAIAHAAELLDCGSLASAP